MAAHAPAPVGVAAHPDEAAAGGFAAGSRADIFLRRFRAEDFAGERAVIDERALPPFQIVATANGLLNDAEMDWLITEHGPRVGEGRLGKGGSDTKVRRSRAVFLEKDLEHRWLYERLWHAALELNRRCFCVEIAGIEGRVQLARYDGADHGFYTWHTDFADIAPRRKISMSVQLSRPEDYDGGELELLFGARPYQAEKARGALIAFPSFALHRVAPVTRGTRWSLVVWISGPRWR